jgi:hypothetical protein
MYTYPSASARRRAAVLLPAPTGPSTAITSRFRVVIESAEPSRIDPQITQMTQIIPKDLTLVKSAKSA